MSRTITKNDFVHVLMMAAATDCQLLLYDDPKRQSVDAEYVQDDVSQYLALLNRGKGDKERTD